MTDPKQPMRKYGVVEPTPEERRRQPLAERKPAKEREREAREDTIRKKS